MTYVLNNHNYYLKKIAQTIRQVAHVRNVVASHVVENLPKNRTPLNVFVINVFAVRVQKTWVKNLTKVQAKLLKQNANALNVFVPIVSSNQTTRI